MVTREELEETFSKEEIREILTEMEVAEILEPEEACNDHGNPEVNVVVHFSGEVLEGYRFEFVHPKHHKRNVKFEKYGYGVPRITEGARESKNRNEAAFKAAEALAEHTGTPVETLVCPTEDMADEWEHPDEKEQPL